MLQYILSITRAKIESSDDDYNTRVKIKYSAFIYCLFTLFFDYFIYFFFSFFYQLFNLGWLDTSIQNQILKRKSSHLASYWVKRRNDYRTRSVIYNELYSRGSLKSPYISAFFTYDLA